MMQLKKKATFVAAVVGAALALPTLAVPLTHAPVRGEIVTVNGKRTIRILEHNLLDPTCHIMEDCWPSNNCDTVGEQTPHHTEYSYLTCEDHGNHVWRAEIQYDNCPYPSTIKTRHIVNFTYWGVGQVPCGSSTPALP